MGKKVITILLILLSFSIKSFSQTPQLTESSSVSLLTCTPNDDAIYALFGHSGLRVTDNSLGIDMVFDYGIFDFSSDNFILRFVKGETDYIVAARTFERFITEYRYRGSGVTEQTFNFTLAEKQQIFDALVINTLPQNRVYRYNFFYDNCATRPRDIVEGSINGKLNYTLVTKEQTYRDLLDECLMFTPWSRFGINIVIGSGADKVITDRQKDFIPLYVSTALANATIADSAVIERKLVSHDLKILQAQDGALNLLQAKENNERAVNEPLYVGILLLVSAILISYLQYAKKKSGLAMTFDTLLFLVSALAGCIIFFLMFFSQHPCVDANWNLVWLNPLPLFFIPFFFVKSLVKYVISYHFVNFVALTLFLVCFIVIPQKLEVAFIPYILAIWLRSGVNMLQYRRKN